MSVKLHTRVQLLVVSALVALTTFGFVDPARAALSITVPASANLGSTTTGSTSKSANLGTVRVDASGVVAPSFVATVSTTVFTTGAGTSNETIPKSSISYWSGTDTAHSGTLSLTPGQASAAAAQSLIVARTAFSAVGLALTISVSWNPTLIVNLPASAVAGAYTGTVTHSVA